jgi:hypothetical protein
MATPVQKRILNNLWEGCNIDMFDRMLKRRPRFHVFSSEIRAGFFTPGGARDHIGVNERFFKDLPVSDFIDTMAHEMIHQLQYEMGSEIGHNVFFHGVTMSLGLQKLA